MNIYLMRGTAQGRILVDEHGNTVEDPMRPEQYLAQACLKKGSTMEGREQSFRYLTSSSQKAAVLVDESARQFYFPTLGRNAQKCEWISYFHVVKAFGKKDGTCEILFDNGLRLGVACSVRTVNLQLKRCRLFLQKINENY
jgi:competence protein ComK